MIQHVKNQIQYQCKEKPTRCTVSVNRYNDTYTGIQVPSTEGTFVQDLCTNTTHTLSRK